MQDANETQMNDLLGQAKELDFLLKNTKEHTDG